MSEPTAEQIAEWRRVIRVLVELQMKLHGESWDDIVSYVMSEVPDEYEDTPYNQPFTIWTHKRVYFAVASETAHWCESVSRNPDGVPMPTINQWGEGPEEASIAPTWPY